MSHVLFSFVRARARRTVDVIYVINQVQEQDTMLVVSRRCTKRLTWRVRLALDAAGAALIYITLSHPLKESNAPLFLEIVGCDANITNKLTHEG